MDDYKFLDFTADLYFDDKLLAQSLRAQIKLPWGKPCEITGELIGNYIQEMEIHQQLDSKILTIKSQNSERYLSRSVQLSLPLPKFHPELNDMKHDHTIFKLKCEEFFIVETKESSEHYAIFHLFGNTHILDSLATERIFQEPNRDLVRLSDSFKLEVDPNFDIEFKSNSSSITSVRFFKHTSTPCIKLKPKTTKYNDYLHGDWGEEIKLILKFLAIIGENYIDWNIATEYLEDKKIQMFKSIDDSHFENQWKLPIIQDHQIPEYLEKAYRSYKSYKNKGFDIHHAISTYVFSFSRKDSPSRFYFLFLTLERIKDSFQSHKGLDRILDETTFSKVKKEIRKTVKNNCNLNSEQRRLIQEKYNDLNRPSIRTIVDKLLEELGTTDKDLFPPEYSKNPIYETRNKLFHSNKIDKLNKIYSDIDRLEILLRRIFLRYLGWDDLSQCADEDQLGWLQTIKMPTQDDHYEYD